MKNRSFLVAFALGLSISSLAFPIIVMEEAEQKPVVPAVIRFWNEEQNHTQCDTSLNKSCFEQYLDVVARDKSFGSATLDTPYRPVVLIDGQPSVHVMYPHRIEIPSRYASDLHNQLLQSDLLVAKAYAQIYQADGRVHFIRTQNHGVWKYDHGYCWKMDEEAIADLDEEESKILSETK